MVELSGVEVQLGRLILPHGPDDRQAETHCQTSLKIDAAAVLAEICHEKPALLDLRDNLVDPVVVLGAILAHRFVASGRNALRKAIVVELHELRLE